MEKQQKIEMLTKEYASAFDTLTKLKAQLSADAENMRLKYRDQFKTASEQVARLNDELIEAINDSPELFVKPQTQTLNGIKVGFRKAQDELVLKVSEEKVIELIETELEDKSEVLIDTKKTLVVAAVKNLEPDELKKIKCTIEKNDLIPLIKTADSAVDSFIKKLISE